MTSHDDPFLRSRRHRLDALARRATPPGERPGVLVSLSGGPDSTALLLVAVAWRDAGGGPVAALHVDHALRGAESDADAGFCRDLCAELAVPLTVRRVDTRAAAARRGRGLEEAARHLRRREQDRLLAAYPALTCVALGHQRDDQLETVLLRVLRGTGLDGLAAMRPVRDRRIRPLLDVGRDEIVAFLDRVGRPYRTDRSNSSGENLRGRLRHEVLPLLREVVGPALDRGPLRLAALAAEESELLHALAADALARLRRDRPDGSLPAAGVAALPRPLARRVLMQWLGEAAAAVGQEPPVPARHQWDRLLDWIPRSRSGGACDLCDGWRLARAFDGLAPLPPPAPDRPVPRLLVERTGNRAAVGPAGPAPAGGPADDTLVLPAAALSGEPVLRRWRPGDRLDVRGDGRPVPVADLFQRHRVPWHRRPERLVVADAAGLLWVPGLAAAARARILPGGGPTVTLRIETAPPSRRS